MKVFTTMVLVMCMLHAYGQVWSADGSRIAFFYIHDIEDIYTVSPDGTDFRVLEGHSARDFAPMWSPDGEHIIFTSVRDDHHEIYSFDAKGDNLKRLTKTDFDSQDASFSPDGQRFVFSSNRAGNNELFISDMQGQVTQLTRTESVEHTPRWSPDGQTILFLNVEADDKTYLYLMDSDGRNRRKLSDTYGFHPAFSGDGTQVCFVHADDAAFEIRLMATAGGSSTVLMRKEGYQAFYPNFSADDQSVTFTRDTMDGAELNLPALYTVNLAGEEVLITSKNSFP